MIVGPKQAFPERGRRAGSTLAALVVLAGMAACLMGTPTASAHAGAPAWPAGRAERFVQRDAVILVPAQLRAALRVELRELVPRFRTLENTAWESGDQQAASRIHNYRYRYSTALKLVEGGLRVADASCRGAGTAASARYRHFECDALSERLAIPSIELVYGDDDALPALVESEPRRYGPFEAALRVHVVGRASIAYRPVVQERRRAAPIPLAQAERLVEPLARAFASTASASFDEIRGPVQIEVTALCRPAGKREAGCLWRALVYRDAAAATEPAELWTACSGRATVRATGGGLVARRTSGSCAQ